MTVPFGDDLKRAAVAWSRVVRNRARWSAQAEMRNDQASASRVVLKGLGLTDARIDSLAGAVIQVSMPFLKEDIGWEARIFPWEYVLSAALRQSFTQPLIIVRHLQREGEADLDGSAAPARLIEAPPQTALILESAPGPLRDDFTFESERLLVAAKLNSLEVLVLADASPDQARKYIGEKCPDVVHLAGFDSHQFADLVGEDDRNYDGYMMTSERGRPEVVPAEQLAGILAAGSKQPVRLAAFNFQNSAARVAAMAVARGAQAAIGFQDRVDDAVAEIFYATFYHYWRDKNWDTFLAFEKAFLELQTQPDSLSGTGIILWSARNVLPEIPARRAALSAASAATSGASPTETIPPADVTPVTGDGRGPLTTQVAAPPPTPGIATAAPASPDLVVSVKVISRVNYSLLHNYRPLFESFTIYNNTGGPVDGIEVQATLYAGGDTFPYRRSLRLGDQPAELKNDIRVPLTSSLLRGVREAMQSVVYVSVQHKGHVLYQDTRPVALVPIEEWSNSVDDEQWLPSFVLPRDPAVDEIVRTARAVLRGLRDSATAEFDGYQSVNESFDDPYEDLDKQVQALWSTLSFHYNLGYIPPPPTYSSRAQRLRSPSTILASRAGTCVDLALLFAACLELIEIYPVVILFDGHAAVGYWRGADLHRRFHLVKPPKDLTVMESRSIVAQLLTLLRNIGVDGQLTEVAALGTLSTRVGELQERIVRFSRTSEFASEAQRLARETNAALGELDDPSPNVPAERPPWVPRIRTLLTRIDENLRELRHETREKTGPAGRAPESSVDSEPSADWSSSDVTGGGGSQAVPWLIRRVSTERAGVPKEIRQRVPLELVLLEATLIPRHLGFADAQQDGSARLNDKAFRAMVDIEIARRSGVTPLPIEQR